MQPVEIKTRWAASVHPDNPLPEYPRPQLVRKGWRNLNGAWSYAITSLGVTKPSHYDGVILVPYPLESALSGVQRALRPDQLLWYRRVISMGTGNRGKKILLHFGAVDYRATVYVNDREIGTHSGGYQNFTFDITDALKAGTNNLVVKVFDPTDNGPNPHGKQTLRPEGILYTATSGIWQTVWLEVVPQTYIDSVSTTPDLDHSQVLVQAHVDGLDKDYSLQATVKGGNAVVVSQTLDGMTTLRIGNPRTWSPDDPFLYDIDVRLLRHGKVLDEVKSYFGLRKIEMKKDKLGKERIFLNGRYTYNLGVLDQGFWPDGLYTAPTDDALKFDIQAAKAMGFNTIRKHVKVEPQRWYYYCDKLGMLVWQDMVPPARATAEAHTEFEQEIGDTLTQLRNHPSVIMWVLFNEGWGAYDQERLARWIKAVDPSRLLNAHSGANLQHVSEWERHLDPPTLSRLMSGDSAPLIDEMKKGGAVDPQSWSGGDLMDIHVYPDPVFPAVESDQVRAIGEHGGLGVPIEGHTWTVLAGWGYESVTLDQMAKAYADMVGKLQSLEEQGLSASIYTQPYDVEREQNGLMSYDRAVIKIPLVTLKTINSRIVPTAHNYTAATKGFSVENVDRTPEAQRYATLLEDYKEGNRSVSLLKRLSALAIKQGDQGRASAVESEFIARTPWPYSKDVWAFILEVTRTSHDKGFEILRTRADQADAVLGENAAELAIRNVIGREEIAPYTSDHDHEPNWASIEKNTIGRYGVLGAEKVYGAEMIQYLDKKDWVNFGKYYMLYFETASGRSEYPIPTLSYELLTHVTDRKVLETATRVCGSMLNWRDLRGENNPTDVDTYANLLYKTGRHREALEWEEKAVGLSQGRDKEIVDHLAKMRAGQPTWATT